MNAATLEKPTITPLATTGAEGYSAAYAAIQQATGGIDATAPTAVMPDRFGPTEPIRHEQHTNADGLYVIHDGVTGRDVRAGVIDRSQPRRDGPLHEIEVTERGMVNALYTAPRGTQYEVRHLDAEGHARYVTVSRHDRSGRITREDVKGHKAKDLAGMIALRAAHKVQARAQSR